MFNLPFPTDSLYKFSFMFGLVLIIFSFYFREKELDRYNSPQAYRIIDSLKSDLRLRTMAVEHYKKEMRPLRDLLNRPRIQKRISKSQLFKATHYWESEENRFFTGIDTNLNKAYKERIKLIKANYYKDSIRAYAEFYQIVQIMTDVKEAVDKEKIKFYSRKLLMNNIYFCLLLLLGCFLFVIGSILWYKKIQKPQDELLNIQLEEARKKSPLFGRKHFEPKILPRPEVRNRV